MKYIFTILASLCLTACSVLSPIKTPQIHTYTLTSYDASAISQRHQGVLLVSTPTAAPGYQSTSMIYTLRPYELKSFAQNRWTAPPADLLAPIVLQNLQASGCFQAVVATPFIGDTDFKLDTQLLRLQQEFRGETSQIHMMLQFTLSNSVTHEVVMDRRIEAVVPTTANDPYAGVIAANKATEILLSRMRQMVCRSM